jgi:hypothetical protein
MREQQVRGPASRREAPEARAHRNRRDRRLVVLAALGLAVVALWLTPLRGDPSRDTAPGSQAPVAQTTTTTPPPTAPTRLVPVAAAGSVAVQTGPYNSRVGFTGLRFAAEPLTGVTGSARLLTGEQGTATIGLRVDFYDARGSQVGTVVQVLRQPAAFARDESGARRPIPFALTAPERIPSAASALITVTTLAVS